MRKVAVSPLTGGDFWWYKAWLLAPALLFDQVEERYQRYTHARKGSQQHTNGLYPRWINFLLFHGEAFLWR